MSKLNLRPPKPTVQELQQRLESARDWAKQQEIIRARHEEEARQLRDQVLKLNEEVRWLKQVINQLLQKSR